MAVCSGTIGAGTVSRSSARSAADVAGPFVKLPKDMMEKAALPALGYESALEGLSDGVLLVFPAAGHAITVAVTDSGACAKTLMLGFLYCLLYTSPSPRD